MPRKIIGRSGGVSLAASLCTMLTVLASVFIVAACSTSAENNLGDDKDVRVTTRVTALPSRDELQHILNQSMDSVTPPNQYSSLVEEGDKIPEFFAVLQDAQVQQPYGVEVLEPVQPGLHPNSSLVNIVWTRDDKEPQLIEGVEFIFDSKNWVLSLAWACTLVRIAVPETQIPSVCMDNDETRDEEE